MSIFDNITNLFRGKGLNPGDGPTDETRRTANNIEALEHFSQDDEVTSFIKQTRVQNAEFARQLNIMIRNSRKIANRQIADAELFADEWAYQHGVRLTTENLPHCMRDYKTWLESKYRRVRNTVEQLQFRNIQGPLASFDDSEVMGDLPSDGDLAAELVKQDPSLKKKF